jgi:NAD-dependent dihydropyrimidine dehydrogenase PreA subunit
MRYLRDVTTLGLEQDACTGCGMCEQVCPHGVLRLERGKAVITDRDACMECGACQRNCPSQAVTVNAGVGCASAVLKGFFRRTEPSCDCSSSGSSSCCG